MSLSTYINRLREYGVLRSLQVARNRFEGLCFDLRHGVDTFTRVSISDMQIGPGAETKGHGHKCDSSPITALEAVLGGLSIRPSDGFVDFGCGKGRALFVAARFPFRRVVGVEFAKDLCAVAEKNRNILQRKKPEMGRVEICEGDATQFPIGADDTFFYWFNPFDEVIMRPVLNNIVESLARHPRRVVLVFCHPTCSPVVDSFKEFTLTKDFELRGRRFRTYESVGSRE